MNHNHLALFRAVAEAGSFSRGAENLCISQPAVSQQIAEFERTLKAKLFERVARGVRLTQAGELLLGYARRLAVLENEAERALVELNGLERGNLTVGASLTVGAYVLPPVFNAFRRHYPGVTLALEIANTEAVQRMVSEGTVDLGLTEGVADASELEAVVFGEDELVAIAPPDHRLLREAPISAARLCREPMILREPGSGTRAVVEQAFRERGLAMRPLMSMGSTEAIKGAVASGMGVAVVSRLTLDLELQTGRLAVMTLRDMTIRRPLHRLHRRGAYESCTAGAFLTLLSLAGKQI